MAADVQSPEEKDTSATIAAGAQFGPWNPGLLSPVPRELMHLSTLYQPQNTHTTLSKARELAQFTGLAQHELVVFRPERLVTHELLIRVAADIYVPTGADTDDLGLHFRAMVERIAQQHIAPQMSELVGAFERYRLELYERIRSELSAQLFDQPTNASSVAPAPNAKRWWQRLLGQTTKRQRSSGDRAGRQAGQHAVNEDKPAVERDLIAMWRSKANHATHQEQVMFEALVKVLDSIRAKHGRIRGDLDLLCELVADRCANLLGSERLGELIEAPISEAIRQQNFRRLPAQAAPVVMNTKGASASGKSSQRQRQQALAARIGVDWNDFALISPDIFRKYLLDYESLGEHFKYAGMLTGEELRIVDQKLDRYMAQKAQRQQMPHLLIDRFRFDSFASQSAERGSNLLTRFGTEVFMFFMVTAPHLTVERAWERGLRVGRFKTVDDLLYHNVEAFRGMPELFFTWALNDSKRVHYEFLDNDVDKGATPKTIAFGSNAQLNVLQLCGLLNIERYRKINIDAQSASAVYPDAVQMNAPHNLGFVTQCIKRLKAIDFVDPVRHNIYLSVRNGRVFGVDTRTLRKRLDDEHDGAALAAIVEHLGIDTTHDLPQVDATVDANQAHTLGDWSAP